MQSRSSSLWGAMVGAVALTFVLVAVYLGVVAASSGPPLPDAAVAEPILPATLSPPDLPDAAPGAVALLDAAPPPAAPPLSAPPEPAPAEDAGAGVAALPEPASARPSAVPPPVKSKRKPITKTRHR